MTATDEWVIGLIAGAIVVIPGMMQARKYFRRDDPKIEETHRIISQGITHKFSLQKFIPFTSLFGRRKQPDTYTRREFWKNIFKDDDGD
jgi:hypothetical protein